MNIPAELKYTKSHEWVLKLEDGSVKVGLTDFAQHELGDLVFINLPEEDDEVTVGESFSDVESVKAVSDVFSPVTGKVVAINEEILDDAALVNNDPYGSWFVQVADVTEEEDLMDAAAYEEFVKEEA